MQPTTKRTRAAIYVKGQGSKKIQVEIESLKQCIVNDGCMLVGPEHIYVDSEGSFKQLNKLVRCAAENKIQVVYIVHDLLATERQQYSKLVRKLYTRGTSVLICE